jgi:hypothetical protein
MTLPKEDLNLIAQIDARLKHYNLIQPIDTTEGEPIETEQRWKPKSLEVYYYINDHFKVWETKFTHPDLDNPRILAGNCFKSEEQANKIKEAIKQYLSTSHQI